MTLFGPSVHHRSALKESFRIVKNIFEKQPTTGLTTLEVYRLARQQAAPSFIGWGNEIATSKGDAPGKGPATVDHPIRSVKFLKQEVLSKLDSTFIKKGQEKRAVPLSEAELKNYAKQQKSSKATENNFTKNESGALVRMEKAWVWHMIQPERRPKLPKLKERRVPKFTPFGYGEDISHLNRRRQRARPGKIHTAVKRMRKFEEEVKVNIERKIEEKKVRAMKLDRKAKGAGTKEKRKEIREEGLKVQTAVKELTRWQRRFKNDKEMLNV